MENRDYRQQAQELFDILMDATGICEDIEIFKSLCNRYPELMDDYMQRLEENIPDVELPEISPEEEERQQARLLERLKQIDQQK